MHWHGWGMGLMWLAGLLGFVSTVALAAWLLRSMRTTVHSDRTAEEILKERYARDEIDAQEYERRLAELRR